MEIAVDINEGLGDARLEDVNSKLLRHLAFGSRAVLNPMAAMFGGIVGQEVVKACSGKFHPIFQVKTFLFGFSGAHLFGLCMLNFYLLSNAVHLCYTGIYST